MPDILFPHEEEGGAELLTQHPGQALRQGSPLTNIRGQVARVAMLHHNVDKVLVPAKVDHVHDEFVLQGFQGTEG